MPIYEYLCSTGHRFERIDRVKDQKKLVYCKECRTIAQLVPSRTGKPILKAGVGGFHAPTKE